MYVIRVFSSYDEEELNSQIEEFITKEDARAKAENRKFLIASADTKVTPDGLIVITLAFERKFY